MNSINESLISERGMNMKRTHLIAVLVGIVAMGIFAADASAMYHPGMGTFMSRDPGAGGANRVGAGGTPAATGQFIPRDPTGSNQYADGMNLYQYVGSNPVIRVDPSGQRWIDYDPYTGFRGYAPSNLPYHHDFNPNGPRAKDRIPGNAKWKDISTWNANTMHISLWDYYNRTKFFDNTKDCLTLGGNFLLDVRGQSELVKFDKDVATSLELDAKIMLHKIGCDQKGTFADRGSRLITADLLSTNVRLSLQRFTVYWEADCWIGPKKCNVTMDDCKDDKCGKKAVFGCDIKWAAYDYYDFEPWEPYGWVGNPFHIFGYWDGAAAGTVTSCKNQ